MRGARPLDQLLEVRRALSDVLGPAVLGVYLFGSGADRALRPVELAVVLRDDVVPWRYPPRAEYLYGEWLPDEVLIRADAPETASPDLAISIWQALDRGAALVGPPAADLLAPVPWADVRRAMASGIPALLDDLDGDARNVLLTLARIWCSTVTGQMRSKDEAATWAMERMPDELRIVLQHARTLYLETTYAEESWPPELRARVGAVAEFLVARV